MTSKATTTALFLHLNVPITIATSRRVSARRSSTSRSLFRLTLTLSWLIHRHGSLRIVSFRG
jgi:hypothetical protein